MNTLTSLNSIQADTYTPIIDSFWDRRFAWEGLALAALGPVLGATLGNLADVVGDWVIPLVKNNLHWVELVLRSIDNIPHAVTLQLSLNEGVQRAILRLRLVHNVLVELGDTGGWKLLREIGGGNASNARAHHVIPLKAINEFPDLMRKAAAGGFDINGLNNGMLLRGGTQIAHVADGAQHIGNHPEYSRQVFARLRRLADDLTTDVTPQEVARKVQDVADYFRQEIDMGMIVQ